MSALHQVRLDPTRQKDVPFEQRVALNELHQKPRSNRSQVICPSILSNRVLCDLIRHVAGKMAEVAVAVWIKSLRRRRRRAPGLESLSKDWGVLAGPASFEKIAMVCL
jgi:hypothetical protein